MNLSYKISKSKWFYLIIFIFCIQLVTSVNCMATPVNNPRDNRKPVSQSTYPYNCIGLVEFTYINSSGEEMLSTGTGFIVGPHTIVTAAHLLGDNLPTDVTFTIQRGGNEETYPCTEWIRNPDWSDSMSNNSFANDWCILVVEEEFGDIECDAGGSLALGTPFTGIFNSTFTTLGYPGDLMDLDGPLTLHESRGRLDSLGKPEDTPMVSSSLFQTEGESGGPLIEISSDFTGIVRGINCGGAFNKNGSFANSFFTPVSEKLKNCVQQIEKKKQNNSRNSSHHIEFYGYDDWHYATLHYEESGLMELLLSRGYPHALFFNGERYVEIQVLDADGQVVMNVPIRGDVELQDQRIRLLDPGEQSMGHHLRIYFEEPNRIETYEEALQPYSRQDINGRKYYEYYIGRDMKLHPC